MYAKALAVLALSSLAFAAPADHSAAKAACVNVAAGKFVCLSETLFVLCTGNGNDIEQAVPAGTVCKEGALVRAPVASGSSVASGSAAASSVASTTAAATSSVASATGSATASVSSVASSASSVVSSVASSVASAVTTSAASSAGQTAVTTGAFSTVQSA